MVKASIKTKSVDVVIIVNILTNHSNEHNQDTAFAYHKRTKKEFTSAPKSALSGHLDVVSWNLLTPAQHEASKINASTKGLGTFIDALIEITC
jgi:hypothetical protein